MARVAENRFEIIAKDGSISCEGRGSALAALHACRVGAPERVS
jgi:hypothetical protein